jgi:type VI protein secretion system component Hcp
MTRNFCLLFVAFFTCVSVFAQNNPVVMKAVIGGVKVNGGSTVAGHVNEIDILSSSSGIAGCSTCTKASFSSYSVMMSLNSSILAFKQALLKGTPIASLDIAHIKSVSTSKVLEYYKVHMENVMVESIQESSSSEIPAFAISFAPAKIAWQHTTDGGTRKHYGWDVKANVEWLFY